MAETDDRLQAVLNGYAKFLREKELALPKHQPYLVRWVKEFLHFARAHAGYTFGQTLDLFLAEVGRRVGIEPRKAQQGADAVRIYHYQYRGARADSSADIYAPQLPDSHTPQHLTPSTFPISSATDRGPVRQLA